MDLGRAQTAKTELRRLADAAARAGVAKLMAGGSTAQVQSAAIALTANNNLVDGATLTIRNADVQIGNWNGATFTAGGSPSNAVEVTTRRDGTANGPVPLMFGQPLGPTTIAVSASSIATVFTQTSTQYVPATSNPWLAGESNGTHASVPDQNYPSANHWQQYDVAPAESPVQVSITPIAGATITVTSAAGTAAQAPNAPYVTADGGGTLYSDDAANNVSEHGIADVTMPTVALLGVFLDNNLPDNSSAPTPLDFSTQLARDYTSLSPQLKQPFYLGNGQTSGGTQQSIRVPLGATRFFLGVMDGHEWSNNQAGYTVTINQTYLRIAQ